MATVLQPIVNEQNTVLVQLRTELRGLQTDADGAGIAIVVALSLELVGYQYDTHYHEICSNLSLYHSLYGILRLTTLTYRVACHRSLLTSGWRGVPCG